MVFPFVVFFMKLWTVISRSCAVDAFCASSVCTSNCNCNCTCSAFLFCCCTSRNLLMALTFLHLLEWSLRQWLPMERNFTNSLSQFLYTLCMKPLLSFLASCLLIISGTWMVPSMLNIRALLVRFSTVWSVSVYNSFHLYFILFVILLPFTLSSASIFASISLCSCVHLELVYGVSF